MPYMVPKDGKTVATTMTKFYTLSVFSHLTSMLYEDPCGKDEK
jgi:hypothetical protein